MPNLRKTAIAVTLVNFLAALLFVAASSGTPTAPDEIASKNQDPTARLWPPTGCPSEDPQQYCPELFVNTAYGYSLDTGGAPVSTSHITASPDASWNISVIDNTNGGVVGHLLGVYARYPEFEEIDENRDTLQPSWLLDAESQATAEREAIIAAHPSFQAVGPVSEYSIGGLTGYTFMEYSKTAEPFRPRRHIFLDRDFPAGKRHVLYLFYSAESAILESIAQSVHFFESTQ